MRVSGLFLRSRVARRVFWALLCAALAPLALFGAIAWQAYGALQSSQSAHRASEHLKHVGNRIHDRIVAVRAALAAHASASSTVDAFEAPAIGDASLRSMLGRVATVTPQGDVAGGDAALARMWLALPGERGRRNLWWHAGDGQAPSMLMLSQRDLLGRGWWLAEIDPDWLWADFIPEGLGAGLCVVDDAGAVLHCSADVRAAPQPADPRWRLFMAAAFGSSDWILVGSPPTALTLDTTTLAKMATLGAVATLLLIATAGLVLVRRTMVPMERLAAGTRRLAAGDWSARIEGAAGHDEFAVLARSFNDMASRVGRQMQALEVQSAIDREILGALDVGDVMRRVAARLQAMAPAARVAVLACAPEGGDWQTFGAAGRVEAARPRTGDALDPGADGDRQPQDGLFVAHDAGVALPAWARHALALDAALPSARDDAPLRLSWVPARWNDQPVALLLLASSGELQFDDEARREIAELRDRIAVTLAAAMREHHLIERAVRDGLTGLLNRNGLLDACDAAFLTESAPQLALLIIDLDGFKEVNDTLGHAMGDELLRAVARRLVELAGGQASALARPGGDEFVVMLHGPPEQARTLAARLSEALARPFDVEGQSMQLGASIGWACCPDDASTRSELLRRADLAMYAAKASGRNGTHRYEAALDARAAERAWLLRELRAVLDAGALRVHYQPRIDLAGNEVCSVEALVRWSHATQGWIAPVRFIPVAEESGLIDALGSFVLDRALAQRRAWLDDGVPVGRVAVNVSASQLRDARFAERVLALVARHGLEPKHLEIELTESLFAGGTDAVFAALEPLRQAGVVVALDDFGTGYSSLSALQRLPVDVLKIDRSFVVDLGRHESAEAVARSVIALARALGKRVVAEGVETELQEQRLRSLGCDEFQGYRYARPIPGEQVAGCIARLLELEAAVA